MTVAAKTPLAAGTSRGGAVGVTWNSVWSRFARANRRVCRRYLQPRLYPMTHVTSLHWWFAHHVPRLSGNGAMLEYGCGTTFPLSHMFEWYFQVRCATDIDPIERSLWPDGVEFRRSEGGTLPFASGQFDAVMILSVLEHVEDPAASFSEIARVLKPGGRVFVSLPNKWDYVSVIARLAGGFKASILRHVLKPTWTDYPVRYRCNTRRALARYSSEQGLTMEHFRPWPSEPAYLSFLVPLYMAGAVYQFVISLVGLDLLQPTFIAVLRKGPLNAAADHRTRDPRNRVSRVRGRGQREAVDRPAASERARTA